MSTPLPGNTSGTARLILGAPAYAVGWQEPVYLADPAVGQNFVHTVDGRFFTRVVAVQFTLVTSAVVANRFPALILSDTNGKTITSVPAGGTVAASSSLFVFLNVNGPAYAFGNSGGTFGSMPDLLVPPGWVWQSSIAGMDAGDQISSIVLLLQRYPNDTAAVSAAG